MYSSRTVIRTFISILVLASSIYPTLYSSAEENLKSEKSIRIEFFMRTGCQNCAKAKLYLDKLTKRHPDVEIESLNIENDIDAAIRLNELADKHGYSAWGVPALYIDGQLIVGFRGADTTGKEIDYLVEGLLTEDKKTLEIERDTVNIPLFGEVRVNDYGLPLFTIVLGLIDGFNPCAMWVLIFLLSLLVNLKSRRRMVLIAGVFVFVSGLVYFIFMAAWLNFFFLLGLTRTLQLILGVFAIAVGSIHIKDFFMFKKGLSLSIPESAKPGIYSRVNRILKAENITGAIFTVIALAAMVNVVELACTAGLPVIYTQILASQPLSTFEYYAYLVLYNIAYMADDSVMIVIAVVTLSRARLQEKGGRVLKLISGLVISLLGLVMIFFPEWLSLS